MEKLEQELIKSYEDNNYHTESVILKAMIKQDFEAIIKLAEIAKAHFEQGSITKEQQELRREIENSLA